MRCFCFPCLFGFGYRSSIISRGEFSVSLSKIMLTFPHLSASGSLLCSTVLHGAHFNTLYSWILQVQALKSGSSSPPDSLIPKLFQLPQLCTLLLYAWQFIVLFIQFSNFPCVLYRFMKNICLAFLLLWWLHDFNFRVVVVLRDVLWTVPPSISRSSYTGSVLFFSLNIWQNQSTRPSWPGVFPSGRFSF